MTIHEQQNKAPEIEEHEEPGIEEHEKIKDYRPFAIITNSLIALMVLTSCLITLLEVLRRVLPTRPRDTITYELLATYPWAITTAPAVIYACLWLAVDYDVMRMEPFYQFAESQEGRTDLNDSLTFSYITCNALTVPLHALKRKQWAVFYSSLSNIITSILLPIVVTEMVGLDEVHDVFSPPVGRVCFYPVYYWITIGLLASVVVLTGILIRTLWGRRSGVKADPSSIVGLAITFAGSDVLARLKLVKPQTLPDSGGLRWLHRRQTESNDDIVLHNHGKETVAQQPLLAQPACPSETDSKLHIMEPRLEKHLRPSHVSRMIKLPSQSAGLIILPLLLLLSALTAIISWWRSPFIGQEGNWSIEQARISRPLLILTGTLIKSLWTTMERDAQISEPFIQLAKHKSGSENAVFASVYGSPFASFFVALRRGYVYPLTVAFTTLLAEINTIFLPSVFWPTTYLGNCLVFVVSVFMLIIWCWACWRAKKRVLPKSPETIAGVLSYLCESRLPHDLQHMKNLNDKERRKAIRSLGREYDLTLKPGSDGAMRWTIDFRG